MLWKPKIGKISSVLEIENTEFYIANNEAKNGIFSSDSQLKDLLMIIRYTKNTDSFFEKALKRGATEICPLASEDNWRIGKLGDPVGHI